MKGERGLLVAAKAAEERSDEAAFAAVAPPAPEVEAKPKRRTFTAAYRLRILGEADPLPEPG